MTKLIDAKVKLIVHEIKNNFRKSSQIVFSVFKKMYTNIIIHFRHKLNAEVLGLVNYVCCKI